MIARYFGLDIHKQYVVAVAVDAAQAVVFPNTRIPMDKLAAWAAEHLTAQDEVALEVTTNSWPVADLLHQHAGRVVVVDPYKTNMTNLNDFELENLNQLDGSPIRTNLAMLVNDVVDNYGQPLKDGDKHLNIAILLAVPT